MELWELDQALKAICPIDGVRRDKTIFFRPEATPEQKAAAQALADAADLTTPASQDTLAGMRFDGMDKSMKATLLAVRAYCNALAAGTYTNKTLGQLKQDFIAAWKVIP